MKELLRKISLLERLKHSATCMFLPYQPLMTCVVIKNGSPHGALESRGDSGSVMSGIWKMIPICHLRQFDNLTMRAIKFSVDWKIRFGQVPGIVVAWLLVRFNPARPLITQH